MQKWGLSVLAALVVLVGYQAWRAEQKEAEIRFLMQARRIDADQIRELMHAAALSNQALEGEKTRAYLAGVTQAQVAPELRQIWHEGYDRGTAVAMEGAKSERKEGPSSEDLAR